MNTALRRPGAERLRLGIFALTQTAMMLLAISNESLWIDEFWTAHFGAIDSFKAFIELLLVPSGSQTPLHFLHFYLWGQLHPVNEYFFRLANLPLFVAAQLAVFCALRDYPKTFSYLFLALSALHPMVWEYANEARPYVMMFAGAQMVLAYLLHLHAASQRGQSAKPGFLLLFVLGGILLFGASLLGAFWVFSASVWVLVRHVRHSSWRELVRGANPWLLVVLLAATSVLTVYYLSSLLKGAGASRLASSTPASVLFAAYELLGLAGIGPGRFELRSQGAAALAPYAVGLAIAASVMLTVLAVGLRQAQQRLGTRQCLLLGALGLLPVFIVVLSGFVMHWRVLGRHLIATLPLLNLVLALGLARLLHRDGQKPQGLRRVLAASALLLLIYSACSLRFATRHNKDDYRAAAALATAAIANGQRVWWAADVIGARYYKLPGEFDVTAELFSVHKPLSCSDLAGVQSVANASLPCLRAMSVPDVVILSKPETFDSKGELGNYLKAQQFRVVQTLPAFTVWRR